MENKVRNVARPRVIKRKEKKKKKKKKANVVIPYGKFGSSSPRNTAAAVSARTALPIPTSGYSIVVCSSNGTAVRSFVRSVNLTPSCFR